MYGKSSLIAFADKISKSFMALPNATLQLNAGERWAYWS